jgi:cytidylate kinase
MSRLIVDIVGLAGSGKSTVCTALDKDLDFSIHRTSDVLRQYAADHGIQLKGREDYFRIHQKLNQDNPLKIIEEIIDSPDQKICLDGFRAPAPFLELRQRFGAILIFLEVSDEERLRRIQADNDRSGHRLAESIEKLLADEAIDYSDDPNLPNMSEMKHLADHVIDASKPLDEVVEEVKAILKPLPQQ